MFCVDYTPDDFRTNLLSYYGAMQSVVDEYYNQVERAIEHAAAFHLGAQWDWFAEI